jgi:hypothetical protein
MQSKKVIFIGGTAHSGSTFLDLMLASGGEGFSAGEVYALYYPYRPYQINPKCGCGDNSCDVWKKIKKTGVLNIYNEIFKNFPKVNFIVDSSKRPIWITKQSEIIRKMGFDVKNVLIYKTPLEYAMSRKKREKLEGWLNSWKNYHKLYFTLNDMWLTIKYSELASNSANVLENLCGEIGIDYFKGKEEYWNYSYHTLFGSNAAKRHLYSKNTKKYKNWLLNIRVEKEHIQDDNYRTIYRERIPDNDFKKRITRVINCDKEALSILNFLEKNRISPGNKKSFIPEIKRDLIFNQFYLFIYKMQYAYKRIASKIYIAKHGRH